MTKNKNLYFLSNFQRTYSIFTFYNSCLAIKLKYFLNAFNQNHVFFYRIGSGTYKLNKKRISSRGLHGPDFTGPATRTKATLAQPDIKIKISAPARPGSFIFSQFKAQHDPARTKINYIKPDPARLNFNKISRFFLTSN